EEFAVMAVQEGVQDYLVKGQFEPRTLVRTLLYAIERRGTLNPPATEEQIVRSIEFPPEYCQAGTAILTYFGQVVRDKYPDTQAKVRIEQDGFVVRLTIETPQGERHQIEELLTEYGLVVAGRLRPEQFLDDRLQVMRLQHKLELAALELRQTKELLAYTRDTSQQRI